MKSGLDFSNDLRPCFDIPCGLVSRKRLGQMKNPTQALMTSSLAITMYIKASAPSCYLNLETPEVIKRGLFICEPGLQWTKEEEEYLKTKVGQTRLKLAANP